MYRVSVMLPILCARAHLFDRLQGFEAAGTDRLQSQASIVANLLRGFGSEIQDSACDIVTKYTSGLKKEKYGEISEVYP